MGKGLHKFFKYVLNKFNELFPILLKSVSEVSHFISEPRSLAEATKLPSEAKKDWLKVTFKEILF